MKRTLKDICEFFKLPVTMDTEGVVSVYSRLPEKEGHHWSTLPITTFKGLAIKDNQDFCVPSNFGIKDIPYSSEDFNLDWLGRKVWSTSLNKVDSVAGFINGSFVLHDEKAGLYTVSPSYFLKDFIWFDSREPCGKEITNDN